MIPVNQLVKGKVYRLDSRNLSCGVWDGDNGFIGIRTKFGARFLDHEIRDLDDHYGTAKPEEVIGEIPAELSLDISLGTICDACRRPLDYELKRLPNEPWHHEDGTDRCWPEGIQYRASPVAVPNDALFKEMEKYEHQDR